MNSKEFERQLAFLSGWTKSDVDQRTRPLRELGILDKGAGRHTPALNYVQAATILGAMVARRAADTMEITRQVLKLRAVPPPEAPEWLPMMLQADRLIEVLAVVLASPESVAVEGLQIPTDGSFAWLTLRRGGSTCKVWFTGSDKARQWVADFPDAYDSQGGTYIGHSFTMGAGAFAQIALALSGDEPEAGYSGRGSQ